MFVEEMTNIVDNGALLGAGDMDVVLKLVGHKTIAISDNVQIVDFESWDKVSVAHGNRFSSIRSHAYVEEIPVKACTGRANGGVHAKQVECFRGAKTNVVGSDANHFHGSNF